MIAVVPISHKYTLICDEVRQEINGKYIILGLYTPDIVIFQIPTTLPSLTFFQCLESDRPGHWNLTLTLQHLETGKKLIEAHGGVVFNRPGPAITPVRFGNVQFQAAGPYNFIVEIESQSEPLITQFSVILQIPPQPGVRTPIEQ
jgi:hypothetical protein